MKTISLILGIIGNFVFFIALVQASFSFTIPQTNINEDQEIEATINLALQGQANKNYYLEGAFKRAGATNYFGVTWNDVDWVNYTSSNIDKSLKFITTSSEGSWSGVLKTKLDTSSSQFQGSGNYILKINRFTATGSSPTGSDNEITLAVTAFSTPAPTPTLSPTVSPTPTQTPIPTKIPTYTPLPTKKLITPTTISDNAELSLPPSILGTSTANTYHPPIPANTENNNFSFKSLIFIAGGIILILAGGLIFTFVAKDRFKKI